MSWIAETIHREFAGRAGIFGVEVGVHRGDNAAGLLARVPGLVLVMVDHWRFHGESVDEEYQKSSGIIHGGRDNYDAALLKTDQFADRRIIVPLDSVTASGLFADETFDFVYLDGDHRLEGVRADLAAWIPKVKPGGFISGHDANVKRWGVLEAVEELDIPYRKYGGCFRINL